MRDRGTSEGRWSSPPREPIALHERRRDQRPRWRSPSWLQSRRARSTARA
jgi:hypothetical protein